MVLLGGVGTILGPIVGAFIFQLLSEVIWSNFLTFHLGILGIITMLVILFIPRGIMVSVSDWVRGRGQKRKKEAVESHG